MTPSTSHDAQSDRPVVIIDPERGQQSSSSSGHETQPTLLHAQSRLSIVQHSASYVDGSQVNLMDLISLCNLLNHSSAA